MTACSCREMMCRSALAPAIVPFPCSDGETGTHIRIPGVKDRAWFIYALSTHELEMTIPVLCDRQIDDRSQRRVDGQNEPVALLLPIFYSRGSALSISPRRSPGRSPQFPLHSPLACFRVCLRDRFQIRLPGQPPWPASTTGPHDWSPRPVFPACFRVCLRDRFQTLMEFRIARRTLRN